MTNAIVDLSHHNGDVDFAALKAAGIVGVLHKATQGAGWPDPMYRTNRAKAVTEGLLWGAYHFGTADSGEAQAKNFVETATPVPSELLALDFEDNNTDSMTIPIAEEFVTAVSAATGRWPGLYCDLYHYRSIPEGSPLQKCWLWLARYASAPGIDNWTLWQYTDGKFGPEPVTVAGFALDRSQFNGTAENLQTFWGIGGA